MFLKISYKFCYKFWAIFVKVILLKTTKSVWVSKMETCLGSLGTSSVSYSLIHALSSTGQDSAFLYNFLVSSAVRLRKWLASCPQLHLLSEAQISSITDGYKEWERGITVYSSHHVIYKALWAKQNHVGIEFQNYNIHVLIYSDSVA